MCPDAASPLVIKMQFKGKSRGNPGSGQGENTGTFFFRLFGYT